MRSWRKWSGISHHAASVVGRLVQVRLPNGNIHDGAQFDFGGGPRVYAYDHNLVSSRVVTPMGWLPLTRGVAMPLSAISITEVEARVFSALRTLRALRLRGPGLGMSTSSVWVKLIREQEDMIGHWDKATGHWIGRQDYQREAPAEPVPIGVYEPQPHESNDDVLLPPLAWFARLKGPKLGACAAARQGVATRQALRSHWDSGAQLP